MWHWNFIDVDDGRIWQGFRLACHQNKRRPPKRTLRMAKQGQGILIKSLLSIHRGSYVLLRAKRHRGSSVAGSHRALPRRNFVNILKNILNRLNCSPTTEAHNLCLTCVTSRSRDNDATRLTHYLSTSLTYVLRRFILS